MAHAILSGPAVFGLKTALDVIGTMEGDPAYYLEIVSAMKYEQDIIKKSSIADEPDRGLFVIIGY